MILKHRLLSSASSTISKELRVFWFSQWKETFKRIEEKVHRLLMFLGPRVILTTFVHMPSEAVVTQPHQDAKRMGNITSKKPALCRGKLESCGQPAGKCVSQQLQREGLWVSNGKVLYYKCVKGEDKSNVCKDVMWEDRTCSSFILDQI